MFKRDPAQTGLVEDLRGAITAARRCERWLRRAVAAPGGRANGGPIIANVRGTWTVFIAAPGTCDASGCTLDGPGTVYALRGSDGSVIWRTRLPVGSSCDPYAPLLADVDGDGARELIVPSNADNRVYALRTEPEGVNTAGSIQWTVTLPDANASSETAPVAVDLDPAVPGYEVVMGVGVNANRPGYFAALDGSRGVLLGERVPIRRRVDLDGRCLGANKADSSSPAAAMVDGRLTIFGGAWDGRLYALGYRVTEPRGLEVIGTHDLPRYEPGRSVCSVRKVRNGPVIAQIIPGGPLEVVFGHMPEDASLPGMDGYSAGRLRMISASGLGMIAELDLPIWKSTPSAADLDPLAEGLEVTAGRWRGVFAARLATRPGPLWSEDLTEPDGGGARSSPVIADIDSDGALEVIEGVEGDLAPGLRCFDARTGTTEWNVAVEAPGVAASPAVGDLDGDGALEVVFLSADGVLHALDSACP